MDDLRQKLFPIFLKEAETNLAALRQFFSYADLSVASAEELESAFRAAHTLKGTANLVQAESICKIVRRLEAMLEKHLEAQTRPTPVEHEAMKLSVDWLAPLVSALQGNLKEPKLFVTEALHAMDLAEAFPGRTPLVELLDSNSEQRSPHLDDPFACDPDFLPDTDGILPAESDPFAEDPAFGMEIDMLVQIAGEASVATETEKLSKDPFADDRDFSVESLLTDSVEVDEPTDETEMPAEELPFDPFAEDSLGLDVDQNIVSSVTEDGELPEPESDTIISEVGHFEGLGSLPPIVPGVVDDPFAEDEDFIDEVVVEETKEETADPYIATTETIAERAEEIAASLLLPDQETAPRKDYLCCVFMIGGRDYHLPIKQMLEISELPQLLPLPLAPPMVSGLINLRGKVIPVINLATLNDHQQSEVRVQRRLVIAEYQHESLAFLADGVPYLSEEFIGEKIDMSQFLSLYRIRGTE